MFNCKVLFYAPLYMNMKDQSNEAINNVKIGKELVLYHQNMQSLNSNKLEFQYFVNDINNIMDIIILTEAWQTNNDSIAKMLHSYEFQSISSNQKSRWNAIYIKL